WHGQLVNRRKDGTEYVEEERITPVLDADGAIAHFVAVKQDVTERVEAQETLRRSEAHFRSLIEHALDVILVLDGGGVVRYASPSVASLLGLTAEQVVGGSAFTWLHPEDLPRIRALFEAGSRTAGSTATAEYRVRNTDGSWRTVEAVGRNLLDDPAVGGI